MDEIEIKEQTKLKLNSIINEIEKHRESTENRKNESQELIECLTFKLKKMSEEIEDINGALEKYHRESNDIEQNSTVVENDNNNLNIENVQIEKEIQSLNDEIKRKQEETINNPDQIIYHSSFPNGALLIDIVNELTNKIKESTEKIDINKDTIKKNIRKIKILNDSKMESNMVMDEMQYMHDKLSNVYSKIDLEIKEVRNCLTEIENLNLNLVQLITKCKPLLDQLNQENNLINMGIPLDNEINEIYNQYKSLIK